ncbi:MAG: tRNA (adenosine(37)-N6)-threonylcarbamoyltransferase complex ATPase subunit type 1 TsaE [Odoribacteraceae bacterium]|nr:tRNA (adenosine(37)-N6)-threonylcarbamoyltransferase complex ATPase subunit type 1 TsaE [Odoribacteraceae bacterium]
MESFRLISTSEGETREIAALLSPLLRAGDAVILDGALGAGKTCFVQGFAAARGCVDGVTSPTFSIANFYRTATGEILHVDLYRIETPGEYDDLGLADYLPGVIALVEWGLKFPGRVEAALLLSFEREGAGRVLTVEALDARGEELMAGFKPNVSSFLLC